MKSGVLNPVGLSVMMIICEYVGGQLDIVIWHKAFYVMI